MQKEAVEELSDKINDCFKPFRGEALDIQMPEKFCYPFYYEPHLIAKIAAEELMERIGKELEVYHDFGLSGEGEGLGKMFGVLVVKDKNGNHGYLSAFSGKLEGGIHISGFVPPVFDTLDERGFYRQGEIEISKINREITLLESEFDYKVLLDLLQKYISQSDDEMIKLKSDFVQAKKKRHQLRLQCAQNPDEESEQILQKLNHESIRHHFVLKDRKKYWENYIAGVKGSLIPFEQKIDSLKERRKKMSAILQQQLFESYTFLNQNGVSKSLINIFNLTDDKIPPAGAGECAAPKLLQYAFKNSLLPVTIAEFWWGKSPSSEIRRHGNYYPACNGKCKPILGHMLEGLSVVENPMVLRGVTNTNLTILFEDEYLLIINKPIDLLSVPGKSNRESVFSLLKQKYPNTTGPLIVHRLDMSTSGIMIIAKSKEIHQHIQNQFIKRKIKKRYIAVLDGNIVNDSGFIDLPLRVDLDDRPRQIICFQHGKPAQTRWQVAERGPNSTLVYFFPVTGRTHQLRVHASHPKGLNTPIIGDDLYGQRDKRLFLHADQLEFIHPISKEIVLVECKADFT